MTLYVYDMAYEQDPATVKANSGIAMARYFVGTDKTYAWKRVTPTQVQQILAAGLGVVVNYEGSADPIGTAKSQGIPLRTYGQNGARAALVDIQACGIPQDGTVACYFSLDDSYGPANFTDIEELFRGYNDVMGPARMQVKAYGDGTSCKQLRSTGLVVGKQWLAAPESWPGYDPNDDTDFCMVQLVGSPVSGTDQNIVHTVTDAKAIGAYWPNGSPYDPPAPGALMSLTDAQQLELYNKTVDLHNWLSGGTAQGQVNEGGTIAAELPAIQQTFNKVEALTAATSGNVWDENITGPAGEVDSARDRLGRLDNNVSVLNTAVDALKSELDAVKAAVSGAPAPAPAPVSGTYTFTPAP